MSNKTQNKAAETAALFKESEKEYVSLEQTVNQEEVEEKSEIDSLEQTNTEEENENLTSSEENVLVKFIKSPTSAPFFLAYNVGEEVEINIKQAAELIELGFAKEVKK